MKKVKKLVALAASLAVVASLGVGCKKEETKDTPSPSTTETTAPEEGALDLSEHVELNLYLMGDQAKDHDLILAELNKLTERDLNASVKITYSTWTDFGTKYNLMLTSGEPMDLVYSANWLTYAQYAKNDAFIDLTDLIPKYAPKLLEQIGEDRWDGVKVDGKIYGVPNQNPEFVQGVFIYREDLRKKHNLPEINSVDTIEAYLAGIKQNEPDIMPTNEAGSDAYDNLFIFTTPYEIVDTGDKGTSNLVIDPKDPTKVLATIETPEYKPFMEKMKSWADQGFWSKSALSLTEDGVTAFENGKAAASFNSTLAKAKGTVETLLKKHPEWEVGIFEYNRLMNKVHASAPTQNLTAIPQASEHPERALALLEKLMTDREYYDLMQYGIKDVSYELTANNEIDFSNIDSDKHGAPSSWAWRNDALSYKQVGTWEKWESIIEENKKLATPNPLDAFILDQTPVQTEVAAINQVKNQYGKPLQAGLVKDVEESYNTLLTQSKNAGLDKYREEVQKQIEAYFSTR
ncbi:extracellular solute-binding protein [Clostridium thermarum]|uniref:extracellular solute-binding protein n=1 Tax=Clostridium thermarum TaxID=1716543 RepID=UPI0013D2C15B|nr:extracellular solute-binding protein [Clostridium thermarum]